MKIGYHIFASVGAGAAFYSFTKSATASLVVFVSGVFIDLDHFIDYFITVGKIKFDIRDFFKKCEGHLLKIHYLLFHSYELLIVLWSASFFLKDNLYLKAIAVGATTHILMDAAYKIHKYPSKILVYSFLYRAIFLKFKSLPGCKNQQEI